MYKFIVKSKFSAVSRPRGPDYKNDKEDLLINAQNFYNGRKMIIEAFKDKIFPLKNPDGYPNYASERGASTSSSDLSSTSLDLSTSSSTKGAVATIPRGSSDLPESISPRSSSDLSESISPINNEDIDPKIVRHYFGFSSVDKIFDFLNKDSVDKDLNAAIIKQSLINLRLEIEKLPKNRKQTKQLDLLANSVDNSHDVAANNQQGQGLKRLTPKLMITRLPILLAELKAGNNSQ